MGKSLGSDSIFGPCSNMDSSNTNCSCLKYNYLSTVKIEVTKVKQRGREKRALTQLICSHNQWSIFNWLLTSWPLICIKRLNFENLKTLLYFRAQVLKFICASVLYKTDQDAIL